ncbi:MAG: nitroreductase [Oscillospiraceae bacterium]|nr:nitroreductase [Oscillospiraceae bacterium]
MENEVLKALKERRSIRKFRETQVSDEQLAAVLEAGTWAPTAKGMQIPIIVAVQKEEDRKKLTELNALFAPQSDPYYGAPTILLVLRPANAPTGVMDASAVTTNMLLAAHAVGLGACWINRAQYMFETREGKELLKQWGIEGNWQGVTSIALGIPAQEAPAPKPRKENYCYIIR